MGDTINITPADFNIVLVPIRDWVDTVRQNQVKNKINLRLNGHSSTRITGLAENVLANELPRLARHM